MWWRLPPEEDMKLPEVHGLGLKRDGTVVGWGGNISYEAAGPVCYGQADIPPGLSNVVAISTRFPHSIALKSDGTVIG